MLMIHLSMSNIMLILMGVFVLVIFVIGLCFSISFQKDAKKKLNEVEKIVKSKEGEFFQAKTCLDEKDILKVNPDLDIPRFMSDLFDTFLKLEDKLNKHDDTDIETIAYGTQVSYVKNKVKAYKSNGFCEIVDGIDLVDSSIIEFTKTKVVLRATIECFNYKMLDEKIVSGSNLNKIREIVLIEYRLKENKWLITDVDKLVEQKMGR